MTRTVLFLFALVIYENNHAQKQFSAEILTGLGGGKPLAILSENIEDYRVFTTQVNASYRFKMVHDFFVETGLGAQWYFSSGGVGISNFRSTSLRVNLPLLIGYPIHGKISVGAGAILSNNTDWADFDFRANYNLRVSLLLKGAYTLNNRFDLLLIGRQNVSNIPDLFLVNQPSFDLSLGVSYNLF